MNPDKYEEKKLPAGWVQCSSKSTPGRKYYFNKRTGKSSWNQPKADDRSGLSKHKSKKYKCSHSDRSRKEEMHKKNLKRKSDSKEDSSTQTKKNKEDTSTPEKLYKTANNKPTPTKLPETIKKENESSKSQTSRTKNFANNRLSQLRAQLATECKKEETSADMSPSKVTKSKTCSSTVQAETHNKVSKIVTESKSPNMNDSKCSTSTQSPSSDSFQSVPSPSQFFAANKIISSMKAQLPEEYCNKLKQKDTFADIEEGICNQTADYPFMKHPATPPQFSEASKLVSAIKSKLTYKGSTCRESPVPQYTSARERMDVLQTRLSNDITTETTFPVNNLNESCEKGREYNKYGHLKPSEEMDIDCKEMTKTAPIEYVKESTNMVSSSKDVVLVVDTNIFIHELDLIKDVLNSHIKGYSEQPTILVPWRVVNELDKLKDNNNGNGAVCKRAKAAIDYLYQSLPENNRIKGQSLRDANSHIYPCEMPDDEILNCCLQQCGRGKSVILLSNDKNLVNKACVNSVRCIELCELRSMLAREPAAPDPARHAHLRHAEDTMYHLLANILENEMRAKYSNLWQHVVFKAPPWSLVDVLHCLLKHWIAVFNEVFPRIEHLITDMFNSLKFIHSQDPQAISQLEVSNFKELCLEMARKCQIIPDYMELAKQTVDRLGRTDDRPQDDEGAEIVVIDAFEELWTVFSSYCAKLSSGLGVPHSIEDKLQCDDPLSVLTSKLCTFSEQIARLTSAIDGALSIPPGAGAGASAAEARLAALEAAFRDSLALAGAGRARLPRDKLRHFCAKSRNMLQQAHLKFCQLVDVLDVCKRILIND